jgi:hypothetical protein
VSNNPSMNRRHTLGPQLPNSPGPSFHRPNSYFSGMSTASVLSGTSFATTNVYVQDGGRAEAIDAKAPEIILLLCLRNSPVGKQIFWMLKVEENWKITDCCDRNRDEVDVCEKFNCASRMVTLSSSYICSQVIVTDGTPPAMSIGEETQFIGGKEKIDAVRSVAISFRDSKGMLMFSTYLESY